MFGWTIGRKPTKKLTKKLTVKIHKSAVEQVREIQAMKYKEGRQVPPLERLQQSQIARGLKPQKGLVTTAIQPGGVIEYQGMRIVTGQDGTVRWDGSDYHFFDADNLDKAAKEKMEDTRSEAEKWAEKWSKENEKV